MYSGDPKRPKNITYYPNQKPVDDEQTDMFQFLSMIFGVFAFFFKLKWAIWVSLILFFTSWVNSRYSSEQKNSVMNFGLIMTGFFMIYFAPQPKMKGTPTPPTPGK